MKSEASQEKCLILSLSLSLSLSALSLSLKESIFNRLIIDGVRVQIKRKFLAFMSTGINVAK